jgi:GntR family transcriptional regulator
VDLTLDYLTQHFQLSLTSTQPIYTQLADYLRHLIQSGVLLPGDKMLGENDIVKGLKISRTTVRQAMNQLVDEGLLIRLRGKGSFVAEQQLHRNINYLYSFTENIISSGAVPASVVVNAELFDADNTTAKILNLQPENRKVFFLKRLRLANQTPLILESTYIPYYLCLI